MSRRRVLVLFAHPAFERSRVHRALVEAARGVAGVTFQDLYEAYPNFDIDIAREQSLLLEHEVIVLQHPMFWYSTPALLKEWQDLVLQHGWAYGSGGRALEGKWLLNVVSSGGGEPAYSPGGFHGHTIREFLLPVQRTAELCRMTWLAPFVVHGSHTMTPADLRVHAGQYADCLRALVEKRVDVEAARRALRLNADLSLIMKDNPEG